MSRLPEGRTMMMHLGVPVFRSSRAWLASSSKDIGLGRTPQDSISSTSISRGMLNWVRVGKSPNSGAEFVP